LPGLQLTEWLQNAQLEIPAYALPFDLKVPLPLIGSLHFRVNNGTIHGIGLKEIGLPLHRGSSKNLKLGLEVFGASIRETSLNTTVTYAGITEDTTMTFSIEDTSAELTLEAPLDGQPPVPTELLLPKCKITPGAFQVKFTGTGLLPPILNTLGNLGEALHQVLGSVICEGVKEATQVVSPFLLDQLFKFLMAPQEPRQAPEIVGSTLNLEQKVHEPSLRGIFDAGVRLLHIDNETMLNKKLQESFDYLKVPWPPRVDGRKPWSTFSFNYGVDSNLSFSNLNCRKLTLQPPLGDVAGDVINVTRAHAHVDCRLDFEASFDFDTVAGKDLPNLVFEPFTFNLQAEVGAALSMLLSLTPEFSQLEIDQMFLHPPCVLSHLAKLKQYMHPLPIGPGPVGPEWKALQLFKYNFRSAWRRPRLSGNAVSFVHQARMRICNSLRSPKFSGSVAMFLQ